MVMGEGCKTTSSAVAGPSATAYFGTPGTYVAVACEVARHHSGSGSR